MRNIFRLRRPAIAKTVETPAASDRLAGEARRAAENETRRATSDRDALRQAGDNEARRAASDSDARRQAAQNETRRMASDTEARRQAADNEAVHQKHNRSPRPDRP
jgi:hypothetical protein